MFPHKIKRPKNLARNFQGVLSLNANIVHVFPVIDSVFSGLTVELILT